MSVERLVEVEEGILSLRISTSDEPYLDERSGPAILAAARAVHAFRDARAVLIEGEGRYFSAGASRETLLGDQAALEEYCRDLPRAILSLPIPSIAVMSGHAVGGGLALGLSADLAVYCEESLYGANFVALGFTPGMGTTAFLEREVGRAAAARMMYSGRLFKGSELRELAPALAVLPRESTRARALELAREFAQNDAGVLRSLKSHLAAGRVALFDATYPEERRMHGLNLGLPEAGAVITGNYGRIAK